MGPTCLCYMSSSQQVLRAECTPLVERQVFQISPRPPSVSGTLNRFFFTPLPARGKAHPALISQCFKQDHPIQSARPCPCSQRVLSEPCPVGHHCHAHSNLIARIVFTPSIAASHHHSPTEHTQEGFLTFPRWTDCENV